MKAHVVLKVLNLNSRSKPDLVAEMFQRPVPSVRWVTSAATFSGSEFEEYLMSCLVAIVRMLEYI